jgi:hypothetical protein
MALESASYISQLVATYPLGSDSKSQGDDHLRLIKNVLKTQFGSLGEAAVTTTAEEINILDGATITTEELNYVDGVTSAIQDQIDSKEPTQTPATQVEMEEGTETAIRSMSPYRVAQAIAANLTDAPTILKAQNGYFIEPVTGLTIQWGYSAGLSSTWRTATFPYQFDTLCASVVATPATSAGGSTRTAVLDNLAVTGFDYRSEANHDGIYWLAIGY